MKEQVAVLASLARLGILVQVQPDQIDRTQEQELDLRVRMRNRMTVVLVELGAPIVLVKLELLVDLEAGILADLEIGNLAEVAAEDTEFVH